MPTHRYVYDDIQLQASNTKLHIYQTNPMDVQYCDCFFPSDTVCVCSVCNLHLSKWPSRCPSHPTPTKRTSLFNFILTTSMFETCENRIRWANKTNFVSVEMNDVRRYVCCLYNSNVLVNVDTRTLKQTHMVLVRKCCCCHVRHRELHFGYETVFGNLSDPYAPVLVFALSFSVDFGAIESPCHLLTLLFSH